MSDPNELPDIKQLREPGAWELMAHTYLWSYRTLMLHAARNHLDAFELYPAFFALRHGIELTLKACLAMVDQRMGTQDALRSIHELSDLLSVLDERAPPEWLYPEVRELVMALDRLDHSSFDFRYPGTRKLDTWAACVTAADEFVPVLKGAMTIEGKLRDTVNKLRRALYLPS